MSSSERAARATETLEVLGIPECADRQLDELSGGQQQRVALGVALANRPRVLLADEPTGELDSRSSDEVFGAIRDANESFGTTVVVVTHDAHVSEQVTWILEGAMRLWIGVPEEEVTLRAGQMVVIPPDVPHRAEALEDTVDIDVFSPIRQDWLDGTDTYFHRT